MTAAEPEISVVVPFYNEEQNVNDALLAISQSLGETGFRSWEIVLVNDGSTDSTQTLLETWGKRGPSFSIVKHDRNLGVGAALRSGISQSRGLKIVTIEGDLTYSPSDIARLTKEIEAGYDVVIGSPYAEGASVTDVPLNRYIISRLGNLLLSKSMGVNVSCVTNSFRAYRSSIRDLVKEVQYNDKRFHPTVLLFAKFQNLKIKEIPVVLGSRKKGRSKTRIIRAILNHTGLMFSFLSVRIRNKVPRKQG